MMEAGGWAFGSKEARERNPPDAPAREVLPSGSLTGPFGLDGEEVCEPGLDRSRVGEVVSEAVMGEDRRARLRDSAASARLGMRGGQPFTYRSSGGIAASSVRR